MERKKILILDDSRVTLKMLIQNLRDAGYATRGTDQLATFGRLLQEFEPDLVLLDLAMPAMEGDDVCREVRAQFPNKHIPIVMISGLAEGELDLRSRSAGADGYISKKAGFRSFLEEVERQFQRLASLKR